MSLFVFYSCFIIVFLFIDDAFLILLGRYPHFLLEPFAEMLGKLETEDFGYLRDGVPASQQFLRLFQSLAMDMLQGRYARFLANEIAEVIGGETELVGTIAHSENTLGLADFLVVVIVHHLFKSHQNVCIAARG